jgi:NitT/TauT family transport system substrate-binding protein
MGSMHENQSQWSRRRFLGAASLAGLGAAALGITGCGTADEAGSGGGASASGTAAGTSGGSGGGVKQVTCLLDWIPKGQTSPFFLALDKGMWADRGLAVQLQRGYGSGDTAVRIGRGEAAYGWAGVSAVMDAIAKGLPLREVAATAHVHPTAVYGKPGLKLEGPDDLKGLRGADNATGENHAVAQAYCSANGLDYEKDINWLYTKDAGVAQIVGDQADFVMDWITNLPEWWLLDPPVEPPTLRIGEALGIYGNGIIANAEAADKDPDALKAFVDGALEGYKYVIDNGEKGQQEAIDALFKYNPEVKAQPNAEKFHLGNLQLFLALMLNQETAETGIGCFDQTKTEKTVKFINDYLLESPIKLEDAFDMSLVSKGDFPVKPDEARKSIEKVLGRDNPLLQA